MIQLQLHVHDHNNNCAALLRTKQYHAPGALPVTVIVQALHGTWCEDIDCTFTSLMSRIEKCGARRVSRCHFGHPVFNLDILNFLFLMLWIGSGHPDLVELGIFDHFGHPISKFWLLAWYLIYDLSLVMRKLHTMFTLLCWQLYLQW